MNKKDKVLNKTECKLDEAIENIKSSKKRKFIESLDMQISLDFNQKSDQVIKNSLILPHSNDKKIILVAFVEKEFVEEAKNQGADFAGLEDIIEKVQNKTIKFNRVIVKSNLFSQITKLAKILGPKDLMPSLKTKTVVDNIFDSIKEHKSKRIIFKSDKNGNIGIKLGKTDHNSKNIKENFIFVLESIKKIKNSFNKSFLIKNVYLSSTMGKSFKITI